MHGRRVRIAQRRRRRTSGSTSSRNPSGVLMAGAPGPLTTTSSANIISLTLLDRRSRWKSSSKTLSRLTVRALVYAPAGGRQSPDAGGPVIAGGLDGGSKEFAEPEQLPKHRREIQGRGLD